MQWKKKTRPSFTYRYTSKTLLMLLSSRLVTCWRLSVISGLVILNVLFVRQHTFTSIPAPDICGCLYLHYFLHQSVTDNFFPEQKMHVHKHWYFDVVNGTNTTHFMPSVEQSAFITFETLLHLE